MPAPEDLQYVEDVIYALENADGVSVDDSGGSITIDTDGTELDIVIQDMIDALEGASYTDNLPQGGEHLKTRGFGLQPDGDLVGDVESGEVAKMEQQLAVDEEIEVTDGFVDSDGWASIEVFVSADNPSALNGVKVDYTDDVQGTQDVLATRTKTFTGEAVDLGFETFKFETDLDGFRVRYQNNGNATSNLTVVVTLRTEPSPDAANYVGKNTLGNNFVRIGTNEGEEGIKIGSPTSLFGDLETIERTTLIEVASSFGTSVLRDETDSTGSGSIVGNPNSNGEIELSTGTTPDSTIDLRTSAYGRYTPGYSAQVGVGVRVPDLANFTEGEARWGYFGNGGDGSGFYFGYDASQDEVFVAVRDTGTEKGRIYESDWNGEDFENVFDKPFNPEDGYIYQINFSWYGYGIVNFDIVAQTIDTISGRTPRQETVTVHSFTIDGDTTIPDPNEPVRVEMDNASAGNDNRIAVGGRQFSIFGKQSEERRITAETRFSTSYAADAWTHIMTWRRRGDAIDANARLDFKDMDLSFTETGKFALVLNGNITGTTFVDPSLTPADETLLEVSTAGTFNGIGSGRKVWEGSSRVSGTGQAQAAVDVDAKVDFGQNNTLSLIAFGSGGSGTLTTTMRLEEDW